jgi:hypothetical protein
MISNPHSPLLVGVVASKASAREANFAAAFLEAALFFFVPQHAGCVFAFDCARRSGAPIPQVDAALATATTAHRFKILWMFIFRSRQIRLAKV